MDKKQYGITKICGSCGHHMFIPLTKVEAAFELHDSNKLWHETPCEKCGSKKTSGTAMSTPEIDEELFYLWGENPDYYFSPQDEDLILAEFNNLPLLLKAFDDNSFFHEKQVVIVNTLFVLLYDSLKFLKKKDSNKDKKFIDESGKILSELEKRKDKIKSFENEIWDYIWKEVKKVLY